jgi:general secretion pathway protein K
MKIRLRPRSNGFALLIVMCAIFVLSWMAWLMSASMKVESRLAVSSNNNQEMIWLGRSGVELARWVLAQEAVLQPFDSLNQKWAGGSGSMAESNSVLASIPLDNYPIGDGSVSVKITDLDRLANINTAGAPVIQQALTLMGVDAGEISVVSDSIQDWVQAGDAPRIAGAKTDYYQGQNPPYNCKEAPMDDISELLLVKGIWDHPEIYDPKTYGGDAMSGRPAAFKRHQLGFGTAPGETPSYPFGLVDLFTPFSSGKININTADANVLQLLPGVDANAAASIIKYRSGPDGIDGTPDDTPYQNANQLTASGINPSAVGQMGRLCDVHSTVFKVTVTAHIGIASRDFNAILYRPTGSHTVQVVSFYY